MVFKRKPKAREPGLADKVLEKIDEEGQHAKEGSAAFEAGRAAEAAGNDEEAVQAYAACVEAYEAHHKATGIEVPVGPYERLAILFRRHQVPDQEVNVIERYLAHAGRNPDQKLEFRLERAAELLEMAMDVEEFED